MYGSVVGSITNGEYKKLYYSFNIEILYQGNKEF